MEKLEKGTGGWFSLGCAQPEWPRTPEMLPPSSPQSLRDKVCASSVFFTKSFVLAPTLYIIRNFVLASRQCFFHISLVSSFWRLHRFVAINCHALKLIGPLAALGSLFEIQPAKDSKTPFLGPDIQITFVLPSGGMAFGYKLLSISGEPAARDHRGSTPRTEL